MLAEPSDPQEAELLGVVRRQAQYLADVVGAADMDLSPPAVVAACQAFVTGVERYVVDYQAAPSPPPLASARDALHEAIAVTGGLPSVDRDRATLQRAATRFRRAARDAVAVVEAEVSNVSASVADVESRARAVDEAIVAAAESVEARVETMLAPLAARATQAEAALTAQETRVAGLLSEQVTKYAEAEERRLKDFSDQTQRLQEQHAKAVDELTTSTADAVTRINELELKARDLVHLAADETISGGFLRYAMSARKRADVLQVVGAVSALVLALIGYHLIINLRESVFSLEFFAGRILIAVPIVGVILLCLREAGRYRREETDNRALHLDHAAFGPYIEPMEQPAKGGLQAAMAERAFFRARDPKAEGRSARELVRDLAATVKELAEVVRTIRKS